MKLSTRPATLKQANDMVASLHRHHKPSVGHRFSIMAVDEDGVTRGVAICGRPKARMTDQDTILEVDRLCTDGTPMACSLLYGACARIAKEMGFRSIQTFILQSEPGTSLKASGWTLTGTSGGGEWSRPSRQRVDASAPEPKQKWEKRFR